MKFKLKLNTRSIILITISIAVLMFTSAIVELNQSREEIFKLLYEHSSSLLESIMQSSENTLNSSFEIEGLITDKLLDNARLIRKLDSLNILTRDELIKIGKMNSLYRINLFDKKGFRVLSNRIPEPGHIHGEENINRYDEIEPVLKGELNEYVIGLKNAEFSDEERFAVAVARAFNKGAIVVNLDAESFLEFRKKIGIGKILQEMTDHHGIEYIVLQDSIGILAASEQIDTIEAISGSEFLHQALENDSVYSRVLASGEDEIYEVVKRFVIGNEFVGIYRLGVSLEDINNVEERMIRRLIIISLILAAISVIVLSIIFTAQNLKTISEEYKKFKTLASSVLENMSESVVVTDSNKVITLFNKSAEQLFMVGQEEVIGKRIYDLQNILPDIISEYFSSGKDGIQYFEKEIMIENTRKYLLTGISPAKRDDGIIENYIIVIKDLTEIKSLEEESKKNEKLMAMGELASGVAHEIRNPINAIGMIAQRLNHEFSPSSNQPEYNDLTKILNNEVERINRIVNQFLSYAKPLSVIPQSVDLKKYFDEIKYLFNEQAKQKKINFTLFTGQLKNFRFDPDLIKQSLMNIIQNAFDAVNENGIVTILTSEQEERLVIEVNDNGKGIPENLQKRIFDLYFTTKKEGNGLGLSIVQKIISQHKGLIQVASQINKGTSFKIILPEQ